MSSSLYYDSDLSGLCFSGCSGHADTLPENVTEQGKCFQASSAYPSPPASRATELPSPLKQLYEAAGLSSEVWPPAWGHLSYL